jgi:hypothetical protein
MQAKAFLALTTMTLFSSLVSAAPAPAPLLQKRCLVSTGAQSCSFNDGWDGENTRSYTVIVGEVSLMLDLADYVKQETDRLVLTSWLTIESGPSTLQCAAPCSRACRRSSPTWATGPARRRILRVTSKSFLLPSPLSHSTLAEYAFLVTAIAFSLSVPLGAFFVVDRLLSLSGIFEADFSGNLATISRSRSGPPFPTTRILSTRSLLRSSRMLIHLTARSTRGLNRRATILAGMERNGTKEGRVESFTLGRIREELVVQRR